MNRKIAPPFIKTEKIDFILPKKIELNNSVTLFHFDEVYDDTVKLEMMWNAGTKYQTKALSSSFACQLILSGTPDKTAYQIEEEIDYFGGYFSPDFDKDFASLSLYGLNDTIHNIFNVFNDAFQKVTFPETELNTLREIKKNNFKVSLEKVNTLAKRNFQKLMFNENSPYHKLAELKDYDLITTEDIKTFYENYYLNSPPTIFLVGNVSKEFISELKDWAKIFENKKIVKNDFSAYQNQIGNYFFEKKGAIQSAIRVGKIMMKKNHPDYYKFQVLNTILGGYFGSRLMSNIREEKGYTYGIGSGLTVLEDTAYFYISTEVGVEVKEETLKEIYFEIDRLKTELVTEQELEKVKNYLLGDFLRNVDGSLAMMDSFINIYTHDLSEEYYTDFMNAIHHITPKQIMEIAQKYFEKDTFLEVVVG